ncbi:MAG TPA: peroxide stress protein YaaA [Actinomycetota bacterium]
MASTLPLILLPPSEGKAAGGGGPAWSRGSMAVDLDERRERVLGALATSMRRSEADRHRLLGVKGAALAAATTANRAAATSPTKPAIERYTGVLYDTLDHRSLSASHRRRLGASVLIFSGLWGLVAPDDPIPDYKLKMGARLGRLGTLSAWWRDELSARLAEVARGRIVWNPLPDEHSAAWRAPDDIHQWSVRFLEPGRGGALTTVSHRNKLLKGELVRFLLATPATGPGELARWAHPLGFRYDPSKDDERGGITTLSLVQSA